MCEISQAVTSDTVHIIMEVFVEFLIAKIREESEENAKIREESEENAKIFQYDDEPIYQTHRGIFMELRNALS